MASKSNFLRLRLDWPLLGKELLEQAARKQMYVMRVAYALFLFGAFFFYYQRHLDQGPLLVLGRGLEPFNFLVRAQMIAIFLFLPPLMAGAIAQEKERETLGLLFLTDLTPWELILQKYIGRLIPMLSLLFLSLPLMAVAYSLGGVPVALLVQSAVTLFVACLSIGAIALECSAHQASTFQALLRCWGLCLVFLMCCSIVPMPFFPVVEAALRYSQARFGFGYLFMLFLTAGIYLLPVWFFLVRAKHNLHARAFVPRRNPFGHQFQQLDQYWKDVRKLTLAILRKRDPEANEIAERVMQQHLGTVTARRTGSVSNFLLARMQVPTLLSVVIIIGFTVLIFIGFGVFLEPKTSPIYLVVGGFWILALLTVPIQSANAVASERINERLGPLLTTPMTGSEILDELLIPVRRWIQLLTRPLALVCLLESLVKFQTHSFGDPRWAGLVFYLAVSLAAIGIYPRLVLWSCLWIGLRVRNQLRAMMTALLVVVAWCVVPLPAGGYLFETGLLTRVEGHLLRFMSPITLLQTAEMTGRPAQNAPELTLMDATVLALAHFAVAAGLLWLFRRRCLKQADHYLGRI